jgi:anionic cell wall polymer biosynthesis LytR-Cps2A-Psr (LCP) family protein
MFLAGEKENRGEGGTIAKREASEVIGLPVHYFLRIDFEGFKKIIDEIGGIEILVEKNLSDMSQNTYFSTGKHHFNGNDALKYVRSRKTTSDFARSKRQQKVLMAIKNKVIEKRIFINPIKMGKMLDIVSENFMTDVSLEEARKLLSLLKGFKEKDLKSYVIDNNSKDKLLYSTYNNRGQYILLPVGGNFEKIHKFVENLLPT